MKNDVNMIVVWTQSRNAQNTLGQVYLNGKWFGYTLMDTTRPFGQKVPKHTSIWSDHIYKVTKVKSPKFGWCLNIDGVPQFKYIRWHGGYAAKRTLGCLAHQ